MGLLDNELSNTQNKDIQFLCIDLKSLSDEEKQYISKYLVEISKGDASRYTSEIIALKLVKMIERQTEKNKIGITSEFFQTVILRNMGFEQNHLFMNLEENSIKKGFDGLFIKEDNIWLLESKSTKTERNHKVTIQRAYNGITDMLSGKTRNDPWENAVTHATNSKNNQSLIKELEDYSMMHMTGNFDAVDSLNVVLGSTVVQDEIEIVNSIDEIETYVKEHDLTQEIVIMLNLSTEEMFLDVLGEISHE